MHWGFIGTILWGLLIAVCYIAVETFVSLAYTLSIHGKISQELLLQTGNNGTAISIATIAGLFVCVPITCGVIKLKKNSNLREYLALNAINKQQLKYWTLFFVGFIFISDTLTFLLGKPIVPEFMVIVYQSTNQHLLLFFALVVAAPVAEETLFRGFLISGFSSTFVGPMGAILISSFMWAATHIQYDLYGIANVFLSGIALGFARLKTNSILVTILMHSLMNTVATVEAIIHVTQQA